MTLEVARREEREDSDIDFLVDFAGGRSLFDQVGLKQDLEDILGRNVDVVSASALGGDLGGRVRAEATSL